MLGCIFVQSLLSLSLSLCWPSSPSTPTSPSPSPSPFVAPPSFICRTACHQTAGSWMVRPLVRASPPLWAVWWPVHRKPPSTSPSTLASPPYDHPIEIVPIVGCRLTGIGTKLLRCSRSSLAAPNPGENGRLAWAHRPQTTPCRARSSTSRSSTSEDAAREAHSSPRLLDGDPAKPRERTRTNGRDQTCWLASSSSSSPLEKGLFQQCAGEGSTGQESSVCHSRLGLCRRHSRRLTRADEAGGTTPGSCVAAASVSVSRERSLLSSRLPLSIPSDLPVSCRSAHPSFGRHPRPVPAESKLRPG